VDVALALDVGGTKVAAGLVDSAGTVLHRAQAPTLADGPEDALWDVVAGLIDGLGAVGRPDVTVCGVGCGGPMTEGGELVSPLNIPAWRDFPLRARLAALLGSNVPVFVDNDAKALALGEGWTGAAVGERNYIAMVVSTGVGGGIVVDGRLVDGATGNAGHIGHVVVEPNGRECVCGARGCLEAEVSGTAIAAKTGLPPADAGPEVREQAAVQLGRGIASVLVLLDLRLAVVSGSVALGWGEPFFAAVQRQVDASARMSYARGARVVPGGLGHDGPLVGAAAVGWRGLGTHGAQVPTEG
jgi:glucokinase